MTDCLTSHYRKSRNWLLALFRAPVRWVFPLAVLIFLAGCVNNPDYVALGNLPPHGGQSSSDSSPSSERDTGSEPSRSASSPRPDTGRVAPPVAEEPPDVYEVRTGDTLYSIAFRYSMDYEELAAANGISAPFTIVPGQKIEMKAESQPTPIASAEPAEPSPSTAPSAGSGASTDSSDTDSDGESSSQNSATASSSSTTASGSVDSWIWPVEGNIVRPFSDGASGSKGIDIDAPLGESVRAAADGKVVYAGDGLRGYGNLIILEHAGRMLSAYAFTEAISVDEQQEVKQGESIASVGSRGDTPLLHFEIRQEGAPVDPVSYLPAR